MLETSPDYLRPCTLQVSVTSVPAVLFDDEFTNSTRSMESTCTLENKRCGWREFVKCNVWELVEIIWSCDSLFTWKHTTQSRHSYSDSSVVLLSITGFLFLHRMQKPGVTRDSNLVDSASSIRLSQRLSHACLSINKSIL